MQSLSYFLELKSEHTNCNTYIIIIIFIMTYLFTK